MSYVEDFQLYIDSKEFNGICKLWEEYCANDLVDAKELLDVLEIIKSSEFSQPFGSIVELAIPLWKLIEDNQLKNDVLRSILDLETSNSSPLSEII